MGAGPRLSALCAAAAIAAAAPAGAEESLGPAWFEWASFEEACGGDCSAGVFAGQWVSSAMSEMFLYGPNPKGPWDWEWREDFILGGQASRRVARVFDLIDLEAEAGVALRFGDQSVGEVWVAAYARWTEFPWNHVVRTSLAVNTGLSLATAVSRQERLRSETPRGSALLHYLGPEITFAPASWERTDLFVRFHHRSGGANIWGDSAIFNGVAGGAQYWTVGIRRDF